MVSPSRCFKGGLFAASLLFSGLAAEAASIKFNRVKTPRSLIRRAPLTLHKRASHDREDLSSFLDGLYTASVTLGGEEYKLILDTGSADMWVDKAPEHSWTDKEIPMKFQYEYANGTLSVDGTVGFAPFKFGTYNIDAQAFLNIHDDDREFFKLTGANGIMGLGLDRSHSVIDEEVKKKEGQASTWGASILNNIFDDDDWEDNYVALDLSRSEEGEDISGGNISIGDFDEQFKDAFNQPKHYVYPKGSPRWTILMDGITVGHHHVKLHSNVAGVESGKAVALVSTDISAPAGYLPRTALDEIFKKAHGSVVYTHPTEGWTRYIVPCNDTLRITYTIGGAQYPIHPLDFTQFWEDRPDSLKNYTVCISTVRSYEGSKADHDISLGAAFLRNVYSIFDFGDSQEDGTLGEPYLQFLPQWTHGDGDHWKDLHRNVDGRPPELEPAKVVQILSSSSSDSSSGSGTSSNKSTNKPEAHSGSNHKTGSDIDGGNILTSANSANRPASSSSGSSIDRFMPAVIALLAVNLIIGLILAVLSVLNYIKKNGAAKKAGIPHYIPVSKRDQVLFDANDNPSGHANRYGYSSMSE